MRYTGKGITAALLDTGITRHPDFGERIFHFQDFISMRNIPYDDNGHGTHVAGILAGSGRESAGAVRGVAPDCNLVSLKVLDRAGIGKSETAVQAIRWIIAYGAEYRIRIVNISVGAQSSGKDELLIDSVKHLWKLGFVVVAAAGNLGPSPASITIPGTITNIITVGSSDMLQDNGGLSGRGPNKEGVCKPDLVAPGRDIVSCARNHGYCTKSGTSMSTPQVAGAAACLLQKYPSLSNEQVKQILKSTARNLGMVCNRQGSGELDLTKVLRS